MKFFEYNVRLNEFPEIYSKKYSNLIKQWFDVGITFIKYVIDKNNPDELVHITGSAFFDPSLKGETYSDIYNLINCKSKNNLTILNSLYNRVSGAEIIRIINQPIHSTNKYLSELLADSNGYLIYHNQFESFIERKMGYSAEEALRLRRSWNKKVIREREIIITNEHYWMIETRKPLYFTFKKNSSNEHTNL